MSAPWWRVPPAVVETTDEPPTPYVPPVPVQRHPGRPESALPCLFAAGASVVVALAVAAGAVAWIMQL